MMLARDRHRDRGRRRRTVVGGFSLTPAKREHRTERSRADARLLARVSQPVEKLSGPHWSAWNGLISDGNVAQISVSRSALGSMWPTTCLFSTGWVVL